MRRITGSSPLLLVAALLTGCGGEDVVELPPALVPVKTVTVSDGGLGVRMFPGRVEANRRAEMSFRVPGKLEQILTAEGATVSRGDIIARLDPTDYRIALENAQAEFDKASSNFDRAKSLVIEGHISRQHYDRDESVFKQMGAALRQAELNLSYTVMRAPFDGIVAQRRVENFQEVGAKQELFSLRDISEVEVRIDVPERIVRLAEKQEERQLNLSVSFPLAGDQEYPIKVKELSTRADPKTQTFEVRFTLPNPEGVNVLTGMTALVKLDLSKVEGVEQLFRLPASALDRNAELPQVWVFDPDLETVVPRPVELAPSNSKKLRVRSGVSEGDRVVVAGVSSLTAGMAVYELPQLEQAEY